MKKKMNRVRNYVFRGAKEKKKSETGEAVFESPGAPEQEAVFSFYTNSERFLTWMKCFRLRYWTDLCDEFDIVRDKFGVLIVLQLKVSLLEGCEISESEQNFRLNEKNRSLYTITCYRTTNNILIQGICRHFWVESEFPQFKRIIDQFHDNDLSLTELYNVQFERELVKDSTLEFSEDDTDFEQEENPTNEAVEDLLLDKIDLCNVHNLKPKTKIKRLNLNKKHTTEVKN